MQTVLVIVLLLLAAFGLTVLVTVIYAFVSSIKSELHS